MSYIRVNISDSKQAINGDVHGSMTDQLIAALTAEPETIAEYEKALERFIKTESDWPPLRGFSKYENLEPYDAGIVAIDLAARVVGYDTTYTIPSASGMVRVPSEFADGDDDVYVSYRVPGEWRFIETMPLFEGTASACRAERAKNFPFDARPILYGRRLRKFIVEEIANATDFDNGEAISDIHARWMMTPLNELCGKTPREILLEKEDFISYDLQSRATQWSITKVCPAPLDTDSFAYQNAGFGPHENVIYYNMVRNLLWDCASFREANGVQEPETEIERLKKVRDEWLRSPDSEFSSRTPLDIIELERQRINMTVSAQEALIDENCPCCVDLSEMFDSPIFSFIDGCNMDDRFEFSFHKNREEWEEEQRSFEEKSRAFKEKWEREHESDPFPDLEAPF